jgi:hypothetical protein
MNGQNVPVQSLIDHIKTAVDVDPWAQEMAARLLAKEIPTPAEIGENGRGIVYYACGKCLGTIGVYDRYCKHCGCAIKQNK